jgi:hypothetical protein
VWSAVVSCCYAVLIAVNRASMVRSNRRVHPLAFLLVQPISVRHVGGDGSSTEVPISGSSRGKCDGVVVEVEGVRFASEVEIWVLRVRVETHFSVFTSILFSHVKAVDSNYLIVAISVGLVN